MACDPQAFCVYCTACARAFIYATVFSLLGAIAWDANDGVSCFERLLYLRGSYVPGLCVFPCGKCGQGAGSLAYVHGDRLFANGAFGGTGG